MIAAKIFSAVATKATAVRPKHQRDSRCGLVDKVVSIVAVWDLLDDDKRYWAVISGFNSILYLCTQVYSEPNI